GRASFPPSRREVSRPIIGECLKYNQIGLGENIHPITL
ncbi:unnamed protein product, partial [Amoebophrya sp. A25]